MSIPHIFIDIRLNKCFLVFQPSYCFKSIQIENNLQSKNKQQQQQQQQLSIIIYNKW